MTTLREELPLEEKRPQIIDDCCRLLDAEVSRKKGIGGLAVKGGYKVLKTIKPGAVREAVDGLLDDFIDALEPFRSSWEEGGAAGTFAAHLQARDGQVAEALVQVTDAKARNTRHGNLRKVYQKLRPSAVNHVRQAVPALAVLIDGYRK